MKFPVENAEALGNGLAQRKEKDWENDTIKLIEVEMNTGHRRAKENGPDNGTSSSEQSGQ